MIEKGQIFFLDVFLEFTLNRSMYILVLRWMVSNDMTEYKSVCVYT